MATYPKGEVQHVCAGMVRGYKGAPLIVNLPKLPYKIINKQGETSCKEENCNSKQKNFTLHTTLSPTEILPVTPEKEPM